MLGGCSTDTSRDSRAFASWPDSNECNAPVAANRVTITQDGLVAVLKQMHYGPMAPVVELRIAKLYPLHDLGKRRLSGFQKQVSVIGHQHVGIENKPVALPIVLYPLQIACSVTLVSKDFCR